MRNEVEFFYFHPQFDGNSTPPVFSYARTGQDPVGSRGQVIVLANMGQEKFPRYVVPDLPWAARPIVEIGAMGPFTEPPLYGLQGQGLALGLDAFQVRVFTT